MFYRKGNFRGMNITMWCRTKTVLTWNFLTTESTLETHTIMIGFEEPVSRSEPSTIANNKESLERD